MLSVAVQGAVITTMVAGGGSRTTWKLDKASVHPRADMYPKLNEPPPFLKSLFLAPPPSRGFEQKIVFGTTAPEGLKKPWFWPSAFRKSLFMASMPQSLGKVPNPQTLTLNPKPQP